jgi:hypothetical protein
MLSIQAQWRAARQLGPDNGKQFNLLGDLGPQGTLVVKQLQAAYGAPTTGEIDADTWRLLQEEYC